MDIVLESPVLARRLVAQTFGVLAVLFMQFCMGCGPAGAEFDRVPPPMSFASVRETARWCPSFTPPWWSSIDASYAVYDSEVLELILREWDAFAKHATQECGQSKQQDLAAARSLLARMRGLEEKSLALEVGFVDRCREQLPAESKEFLDLLAARRRFVRAGANWAGPDESLPGVLELLALDGGAIQTEALARAATDAYHRCAEILERERRRRFAAYLVFIEGNTSAVEAQRVAKETFGEKSEELQAADARIGPLRKTMEDAYKATDQVVRRALEAEALAIVPLIVDAPRRACFEDRVFEHFALDGVATPNARGKFAIWRALADLAENPQERARQLGQIAGLEAAYDAEWKPIRQWLSEHGNVPSQAILHRARKLRHHFDGYASSGTPATAPEFDRLAHLVASRSMRASEAAAILRDQSVDSDQQEATIVADALTESRDPGMRLFAGWPLHPSLTESIASELQLDAKLTARVEEIRREETDRLAKETKPMLDRVKDLSGELESEDGRSVDVRVRGVMQVVRTQLQRTHAADLEANRRFLDRVVAEFRVQDPALQLRLTRLRAVLLCSVGISEREESSETVAGLTEAATVDLTRLPRAAGLREAETEAFIELVLGHADELTDAAQAAHERMIMNVGRLLRIMALKGVVAEYWETLESGADAADLRLGILSEARRVLGPDAGDQLDSAFRNLAAPGLEVGRPFVIDALHDCIENPASAAPLTAAAAVAVAEADARYTRAMRDAMRWRAHTVLGDPAHQRVEWDSIARAAPQGALLRMRASDADERALASVAAALQGSELPAWLVEALEAAPPTRVRGFQCSSQ